MGRTKRTAHELPALAQASAMSTDGLRLALAARTGELCVVHLGTRSVVLCEAVGESAATSVAWSRDGALLSSLGADGEVRVLDAASGRVVAGFRAERGAGGAWSRPHQHAFVAGDQRIVVASRARPGEIWDWRHERLVAHLEGGAGSEPSAFAVSRSGRLVAVGDARGTVRAWDTLGGTLRGGPWVVPVATGWPGHLALAFAPDDSHLAIGCGDGVVRLQPLGRSSIVRELGSPRWPFQHDAVGDLCFSEDGASLAVTLVPVWDKRIFDVASGRLISELDRGGGSALPVGVWFTRDGGRVVFGDGRQVREARDLSRLLSQDVHYGASWYRSDGEHVWAVTGGMLRIFRVLDGSTVLELPIRT